MINSPLPLSHTGYNKSIGVNYMRLFGEMEVPYISNQCMNGLIEIQKIKDLIIAFASKLECSTNI